MWNSSKGRNGTGDSRQEEIQCPPEIEHALCVAEIDPPLGRTYYNKVTANEIQHLWPWEEISPFMLTCTPLLPTCLALALNISHFCQLVLHTICQAMLNWPVSLSHSSCSAIAADRNYPLAPVPINTKSWVAFVKLAKPPAIIYW